MMDTTEIEITRHEKDDFFKSHSQSPLMPDQKRAFGGLSYYEPNARLVFDVEVNQLENEDRIQMQTSTGAIAQYIRYGRFKFEVDGETLFFSLKQNN